MKKIKKTLLCLSVLFLFSCNQDEVFQKDETNNQEVKAKEIQSIREFQSMEEFDDYYSSFTDQQSFDNAVINYREVDPDDEHGVLLLSPMLRSILNENNEFKIADTIIKLENKKFYKFNINDRHLFEDNLELYHTDFIQNSALNNALGLSGQGTLASLKFKDIGGSHQYEFYKQAHTNCFTGAQEGPSQRKLKYVHELVAEYKNYNGMIHAGLHLAVKLEWNPSGNKWRAAGEGRKMDVNIQGSARVVNNASGGVWVNYNYNINRSFNCERDQKIFIAQFDAIVAPKQYHWDVSGSGLIKHSINNTNVWNNVW